MVTKRTKSKRRQCWRNIMVAAINAGLDQGVFSLQPGGNWWAAGEDGAFYEFAFAPGIYAVTYVRDIGFDELAFETVLCPESLQAELLQRWRRRCGDPTWLRWVEKHCLGQAKGLLERRKGAWLQELTDLTCRRTVLPAVLGAAQAPRGYADDGPLMILVELGLCQLPRAANWRTGISGDSAWGSGPV